MTPMRRFASGALFMARGAILAIARNLGLAALSLALALSLWLFVTDKENPTEAQTFNSSILIQPVNVPGALAVANVSEAGVRIRIEAPKSELDGLRAEDFEATLNLGGFAQGTQSVPVDVTPPNSRISIVSVAPERVDVTLESRRTKEVPVRVSPVGSPVTGFVVVGERADPETATVTGPESLVALVDSAVAVVNLAGQRVSVIDDRVKLEPRDARDGGISRVVVEPETAEISIELEQREYSLQFAVNPVVTGQPAAGYNLAGISVEPRLVNVTGSLELLQSIDAVRGLLTDEISVADARDDVIRTVEIDLPAGATVRGSSSVSVTIDISPAPGEFSFRILPQIRNTADGLVVTPAGSIIITLTGDIPVLEDLTAVSIVATVDVEGLRVGLYVLPVVVTAPPGTTVELVDPQELGVAITLRQ
jgi:YbbR domain-containing protein